MTPCSRYLPCTVLLVLAACGGTVPTSTSLPVPVSAAITVPETLSAPVSPPTNTPGILWITLGTPDIAPPDPTQVPVPPSLVKLEPGEVAPGDEVQIEGLGGLIELRTADGRVRGYIESAKSFDLFFDGEPVGAIVCQIGTCRGTFAVPGEATPGRHEISVEGGSSRSLTVVDVVPAFGLGISSFPSQAVIPVGYTCDGEDVSPGLSWTTIPPGTETFVVLVDDPDAPSGTWTHWLVFNIPGDTLGLEENQPKSPELLKGGVQGSNSWGDIGYGGLCPPRGSTHGYRFFLYALDTSLDLPAGAARQQVDDALSGHIVAEHWITRTYGR